MHAAAGVTPLRVVLADDTATIRSLLRRCFQLDPEVAVVGEASNGVEAVEVVERTNPDVILLDLVMPVMDGLEAIPEIRRRCPATEIVVLSGFDASKMEERALAAGAAAYVAKGAGPDEILAVVRRVGGPPDAAATQPEGEEAPGPSVETAYRRQHDLLPLVTHEIGNQLTVIQGFAGMLHDGITTLPEDTARQFAEAIVRNSRHMRNLIDAVSDLRQLEVGQPLALDLVSLDLVPLVREAVEDMLGQLGRRRVSLALPARAQTTADPVRIRQTLTNLLSNAAKFTQADATVTVQLTADDVQIEVAVADNGPGIPRARADELFEKFSRLGTKVSGTGIGLYLSRAIARAHGGDLVLVPQAVGCRFALLLPANPAGGYGRGSGGRRRAGAGPAPAPATT